MRLIIVSGLSGSGKSVALAMLEDLDYYCVDNIPADCCPGSSPTRSAQRARLPPHRRRRRCPQPPGDLADVPRLVAELRRSGIGCESCSCVRTTTRCSSDSARRAAATR